MRRPSYTTLLLISLSTFLSQVLGSGVFELSLERFTNDQGVNSDGNCCTGIREGGTCQESCRTFFRVCLNHYQSTISVKPKCTFGEVTTPIVGPNSFKLADTNAGFTNPIRLPFDFAWPGTFTLIIEAWHSEINTGPSNDSPRDLITQISVQRSAEITEDWGHFTSTSETTELQYKYRVACDDNYYGAGCQDLCKPRDDRFGHYTCSANGTMECLEGWTGEYCEQAICLEGCHSEHGYCEEPYECRCRMGWRGNLCDQCIPYPGCQHGSCAVEWECNCDEGWGGAFFCNQDLNFCTHHQPCRNQATCTNTGEGSYTCECPRGFTGTNCEIALDDCQIQPCLNNGTCTDIGSNGYQCKCPAGFHGRHCESSATSCSEEPCKNGATCVSLPTGYQCQCRQGYVGVNCESERDECSSQPCRNNGRCIDENNDFRCVCSPGFSGPQCEENRNDCSLAPCLNGGSCIDMVNDFRCRCLPGFVGSLCQTNLDDCLTWPCANGGTCHDLVNDFSCSCSPGFAGKDCRNNIDECDPNPCQNGGNCTDQVNDFGCSCLPDFYGKRCEIRSGGIYPPQPAASTLPPPQGSTVAPLAVRDDSILTLQQLLLVVCVGVGLPVLLIIFIILVLLLTRRRSRLREAAEHKDNVHNENRSMNNKLSSMHDSPPPPSSSPSVLQQQSNNVCFKVTNEQHLKCNNLIEQHQAVKECHKDSLGRPPQQQQQQHQQQQQKNGGSTTLGLHRNYIIKPTIEYDPTRDAPSSSSSKHCSSEHRTTGDVHIEKPINKDPACPPSRSSIFFLEKPLASSPLPMRYPDEMLATEV